jgi:hypothetical protein
LQYIVRQYEKQLTNNESATIMKFPFKMFKNKNWDVEHIDSHTTNAIKDKRTAVEWLKAAWIDLGKELTEMKNDIIDFIVKEDNFNTFEELRDKIRVIAEEKTNDSNDNDEEIKNSLGNLTLLDATTNRSYGNALFPTKRRIIIEKDTEGTFIPIGTKNVFLKYFDKQGSTFSKWTKADIANYQNNIGEMTEEFLTFNNNNNNNNNNE